jgi:F0F1-type ATP synthase assembly protein I
MSAEDSKFRDIGQYLPLAAIGLEMVVPIVVGVYADRTFGWSPWGALTGVICGFVVGIAHAISIMKKYGERRTPKSDDKP